jgi:uncharacterized membrane protein YbhN (UPF0104 family)
MNLVGRGSMVPPRVPLTQLGYWLAWALHGVLVLVAFRVGFEPALGVSGLFALAPVAGFLALAAPAGVGVREAVLAVGLLPLLGAPGALGAMLLSRACSFVADFALWIAWLAAGRLKGFA